MFVKKRNSSKQISSVLTNDGSTLSGAETTKISKTLFSYINVQIMLSLVNVGRHGNNTRAAR